MDPTKPASKPNTGVSRLVTSAAPPKKSFADTLAAKNKKNDPAAAAATPSAEEELLEQIQEHLGVQMSRSILQAPKPKQLEKDKTEDPNQEEG